MVDALKQSPEQADLVAIAKKKVVGLIGNINQEKRKRMEQQLKDGGASQVGRPEHQQHPSVDGAKAVQPSAGMDHRPQGMGDPPMGTFQTR